MAVPISYMWKIIRDAHRRQYERRIAAGEMKRLNPKLEAILFEYENDQVLTMGGRIPRGEVNAKIEECAAVAGVSPQEFKEMVVNQVEPKTVK